MSADATWLPWTALAVGVLALLLSLLALRRAVAVRNSVVRLGAVDGEPLLELVGRQVQLVEALRGEVAALGADTRRLRVDLGDAVRHLAVVRYDAFGDMGGRLSFSVALLDDGGDGVVLTSIAGRTESRSYAKGVKAGRSDTTLAPEEEQAIRFAMGAATGDDR